MPFISKDYPVMSADRTRTLGRGTIYERVTVPEYNLWCAHKGYSGAPESGNADPVDFNRTDYVQVLRHHLSTHGVPPAPFVHRSSVHDTCDGALTSFASIQLTKQQLERMALCTAADGEGDWVRANVSDDKIVFSPDSINTSVQFKCPGVYLSQTRKGWLLYEGPLECGLSIPTESKELVKGYGRQLGDTLRQLENSGHPAPTLCLRLTQVNEGRTPISLEDAQVRVEGHPEGKDLPPGMVVPAGAENWQYSSSVARNAVSEHNPAASDENPDSRQL